MFDAFISEQPEIPKADATKKYGELISKLIDAEITRINNGIDDYVIDTFHAFVKSKKKIVIDVVSLMSQVDDKQFINNIVIDPEIMEWTELPCVPAGGTPVTRASRQMPVVGRCDAPDKGRREVLR